MLFQISTMAVLALFYGCYFYKMWMQRRNGIRTDQLGKGKTGFLKWIEIIMKLATYSAVVVEVVSIMLKTGHFPTWLRTIGLLLMLAGVAFFVAAVFTMRDSWRAGVSRTDKTELVVSGIFQISRNPAFLGFDLVYIGVVFVFFNIPLLAISVIASLMLHLQIVKQEEPFLQEAFGEEYLSYKKHVNRYFGRH